jgi:RNA polymerase sigma-70 factor, ECF subfamily
LLEDEEIVRRIRAGDRALFEVLFRRHNPRLQRAMRSMLRNFGDVEDVLQETWLRAFVHLDQFSGRGRFAGWIMRIAIYQAWSMAGNGRRNGSGATKSGLNDAARASLDPEHEASDRELHEVVETAISALPEKYRRVLVLRAIEGLSTGEVARSLELSRLVVKTRLHRARTLLRNRFSARIGSAKRGAAVSCGSPATPFRLSTRFRLSTPTNGAYDPPES